jgi:hypothetical protein
MNPVILFRKQYETEKELEVAKNHFLCVESRINIQNKLVIGRYSVLPYYRELERDLKLQGSYLINSFEQHQYIANFDYYEDLYNSEIALTPKTYFELKDVPKNGGPFIVKGRTNSKKQQWKEKMYAENYESVVRIYSELMNDPFFAEQGVIIRDFIQLKTFEYGVNGQPFTNEWRLFFYKEELLAVNYYWSQASHIPIVASLSPDAFVAAKKAASLAKDHINFFVVDVAEGADGIWRVIELNDGQQSGLSEIDPNVLYSNLSKVLTREKL